MAAETHCVFCKIVAGTAPAHRVYEDEKSLCILDINPFTRGHCLVIPKRHVPWWHELDPAETTSLFAVARTVANRLMAVFEPDFVCMYARGRRIPHTHLFLVPTYKGDVLDSYFNALERFQEAPQKLVHFREEAQLAATAEKLRNRDGED
jgi:histidine triad (HIT) family protein